MKRYDCKYLELESERTCEFGRPDLRVDVSDGETYSESAHQAYSLGQVSDDQ